MHKSSGTTSNLIKHLSAVHPTQWQGQKQANLSAGSEGEERPKKHETLDKFFRSTVCSASRAGQLTNAIVDLVAIDMRPVTIVTVTGFRRLLMLASQAIVYPQQPTFLLSCRKNTKREKQER